MGLHSAINTFLLPLSTLVLILLDYKKHCGKDKYKRGIAVAMFTTTFITILMEFLNHALDGVSGDFIHFVLVTAETLFYIFQLIAASCLMLFLDYIVFKSIARTKFWFSVLSSIVFFNTIFLILNIHEGFYFYYSSDNVYHDGKLLILRLMYPTHRLYFLCLTYI